LMGSVSQKITTRPGNTFQSVFFNFSRVQITSTLEVY